MIYDYKCEECGEVREEVRRIKDRNDEAICSCGGVARRIPVSFGGSVGVGTFKEDYYHAFGKHIGSKAQLNEELARVKGETGKELIEVGNDSMKSVKKERKTVDWDAMGKELRYKLNKKGN